MEIKRRYVVDQNNRKVAVQLDLKTFERMEEVLENYALSRLMEEVDDETEALDAGAAEAFYEELKATP